MGKDSGEILFKYFNEHNKNKKIKSYFAVDKHYKDYNRMKKYGNVVSYHSMKYKLLFLTRNPLQGITKMSMFKTLPPLKR